MWIRNAKIGQNPPHTDCKILPKSFGIVCFRNSSCGQTNPKDLGKTEQVCSNFSPRPQVISWTLFGDLGILARNCTETHANQTGEENVRTKKPCAESTKTNGLRSHFCPWNIPDLECALFTVDFGGDKNRRKSAPHGLQGFAEIFWGRGSSRLILRAYEPKRLEKISVKPRKFCGVEFCSIFSPRPQFISWTLFRDLGILVRNCTEKHDTELTYFSHIT